MSRIHGVSVVALVVGGCLQQGTVTQGEADASAWDMTDDVHVEVDVGTTDIQGDDGAPTLVTYPEQVDFGAVPQPKLATRSLTLANEGTQPLVIDDLSVSGDPGFSVWSEVDPPFEIPAGYTDILELHFQGESPGPATTTLWIDSNDPDGARAIEVRADASGPCLTVSPTEVALPAMPVGNTAAVPVELSACGDAPVTVSAIELLADAPTTFALDLPTTPLVLDPGETATVGVFYTPDAPDQDVAYLGVTHDGYGEDVTVVLTGSGLSDGCPVASIDVQEGEEVIPQTKLHLSSTDSIPGFGVIAKHAWTVDQPPGSQSVFLPSASHPNPTFVANVAGTYVFHLRVWDQNGTESCIDAEYTVYVFNDEAIHIELLWDTPGDPDQTDEGGTIAGTDLDLHFRHPFASGEDVDGDGLPDGWFDQPFDCFWFNPHPNWGMLDPMFDDDPGLDREDNDGAGPEIVNLNVPQDGLVYTVGVHAYHQGEFGPSTATVRVYVYSSLVAEYVAELDALDMWQVATLSWPDAKVTPILDAEGAPKILPDYVHP